MPCQKLHQLYLGTIVSVVCARNTLLCGAAGAILAQPPGRDRVPYLDGKDSYHHTFLWNKTTPTGD